MHVSNTKISDIKNRLDNVEARLQAIIEGGITLLLPLGNPQQALAQLLISAIRPNLMVSSDGQTITVPNTFLVNIHPSRLNYWQSHQSFLDELANELFQAGSEVGFYFKSAPHLVLVTTKDISPNDLQVTAVTTQSELGETSSLALNLFSNTNDFSDPLPLNAFLIVNGNHHYPLRNSVTNIGRRLDNHLVIDDPRVSRNHIQLRAVKGRFIIFDLNSTGGTYVNGKRVNKCILSPGDVISLAGFPLIYGQDTASSLADTGSLVTETPEDSQPR
jgi:hypothetical protein